ncbi:MAG: GtrA family protein [Micavibrio sp.]|nr:GtrA family protein [Micavibrio sp.]
MLSQRQALELLERIPVLGRLGPQFLRYLFVGGIGFIVDAGGMELFIHLGMQVYHARLLSMAMAIASTYLLHRLFTFADSAKPKNSFQQFAAFFLCQSLAAAANYGVFCALLALQPQPVFFIGRMFALCSGVAVGLAMNFVLLRRFVFPIERNEATAHPLRWLAWLPVIGYSLYLALQRQAQVLKWPDVGFDLGPADSDVWLRLNQARQWMSGDRFFDHAVRNTNAPYGGIDIHWTRPLDALLRLFVNFMPPDLPVDMKLLLASAWLPPVLGIIAFGFLLGAAQRRFSHLHTVWCLFLLVALSPLQQYFLPGESDHHGLLSLLWCGAIFLLMRPLSQGAALLCGIFLGVMFWISSESLLLIGLVLLALGLISLRRSSEMRSIAVLSLGLAATSIVGLMVEVPPEKYFSFQAYDTLSIVFVALFSFIAAGATLLAHPTVQRLPLKQRIAAGAIVAGLALGAEILAYPKILLGPMADADPYITNEFFKRVTEAMPLYRQPMAIILKHLWQPALAALVLAAVLSLRPRELKYRQAVLLAMLLLGTFLIVLVQGRWTYYLQPVAIVAIAGFLPSLVQTVKTPLWRFERPLRPYVAIFAVYLAMIAGACFVRFDNTDSALWQCQSQMRYIIQSRQLQPLLGTQAFTLYTPPEVGGDILFFTPYRIIAGEYHREGRGLHDLADIAAETNTANAKARLKKRGVDAVLACPMSEKAESWLHKLDAAHHPAWLTPVTGFKFMDEPGPRPQLFVLGKQSLP